MVSYSSSEMTVLSGIFMVLPVTAVILRFWAVKIRRASFTIDDYIIVPAMICALVVCCVIIYGTVHGAYGSHQALGPDGMVVWNKTLENFYKCDWIVQIFSTLTIGFSKISVLLLYKKIFSVRIFKLVSMTSVGIMVAWTIAFTLTTIFQCNPVHLYWTELEFLWGDSCIQIIPFYQAQAITDIITDFAVLVMPMPMIWGLQLPSRQKLAVTGMFLLGLIASTSGIVRLVVFFQVGNQFKTSFSDIAYRTSPVFIWTVIEASLTVVCACLPTLRPIFIRHSFRSKDSSGDKYSNESSAVKGGEVRDSRSSRQEYEILKNHTSTENQSLMPSITINAVDTQVCRANPEPIRDGNNRKDTIMVKSEIHSYEYQV